MADYIPNTKSDIEAMLGALNLDHIDALFDDIPKDILLKRTLDLAEGKNEIDVMHHIETIANKNDVFDNCFLGAGVYNHFIPSVVKQITSRSEFVTGYTPYQAEISQGVLQSIFEYQTMMCQLTGLDASNASVYDGATAVAEAVMMCTRGQKNTVVVSDGINPQYMRVLETWCEYCGVTIKTIAVQDFQTNLVHLKALMDDDVGAVVLQNPNFFGSFEDMQSAGDIIHNGSAKFISVVSPISLAVCMCPADYGADIAVGEGQPLGNAMAGGGPYFGFMVTTKALMRKLPGRIVGQTQDTNGARGFVLTLQAREQHIRRERASSNICSNQALNALTAAVYLSALGPKGLYEVACLCNNNANMLYDAFQKITNVTCYDQDFFNEFVVKIDCDRTKLQRKLNQNSILGGLFLGDNRYLYCATELNTPKKIDQLIAIISEVCHG
jgi:glycine dehydrogenase subunit 1